MLLKVSFPISNYYGDNIFEQELIIETDKNNIAKEDVLNLLKTLDKEESVYPEYTGGWKEAAEIATLTAPWPYFISNNHCQTVTQVFNPYVKKNGFVCIEKLNVYKL